MTYPIDDAATADAGMKAALRALTNTLDAPVTISASGALSSTHYGKIVYADTASIALTLPTAPATNEVLRVFNGSAGNITVNGVTVGAGKDIIYVSISSAWKRFEPQVTSAGGGGITFPAWVSGNQYSNYEGTPTNGAAHFANLPYFMPHFQFVDATISGFLLEVATAAAAGKVGYIAIYATDASHLPTTVLARTAAFAVDSTGLKNPPIALDAAGSAISSLALTAGTSYQVGFISDGAPTLKVVNVNGRNGLGMRLFGSNAGAVFNNAGLTKSSGWTAGTWQENPVLTAASNSSFHPILVAA